jgi:hypothetical protein
MIVPHESFISTDSLSMQLLSGFVALSLLTFIGINAVETIGRTYRHHTTKLNFKLEAARLLWSAAVPALLMAAPVAVVIGAPLCILESGPSLVAIAAPDLVVGAALPAATLPI